MPRSAFTAHAEQHIFLILLADTDEMSTGLRAAIDRLVEVDEESASIMEKAKWLAKRSAEILDIDDPTQKEVLDYAKDNLPALLDDWRKQA